MEFSLSFWALLIVKYGRFFTLVLFWHMDLKKVEKFNPEKRLDIRVGWYWQIFWFLNFLIFGHTFLQNHQNVKSCGCFGKFRKFAARWAQKFLKLMKSRIFPGLYFQKICSFLKPKSTKVKNRPYLTVKRAQKQQENSI